MSKLHTDRKFEAELNHVRESFTAMGEMVEEMVAGCFHSYFTGDLDTAYQVVQKDYEVNRYDIDINEQCLQVIARRQPLGPDLRLISAIQKSVTDLERIADLCVNISERTIELRQQTPYDLNMSLKPMTELIQSMVHDVIDSFHAQDSRKAREVLLQDRKVDAYYAEFFRHLLDLMRKDSSIVSQATRIIAILNNLERIGDHVKNISEKTIFLATGKDIRHMPAAMKNNRPIRGILFLCVQNSARSQIAEGWAGKLLPAEIDVFSAGSAPADRVHPKAIEVMNEVGIDISGRQPKRITDVPLGKVDMVITLCSEEVCVNLPGDIQRRTWFLPDPAAESDAHEQEMQFRQIRDAIQDNILKLIPELSVCG